MAIKICWKNIVSLCFFATWKHLYAEENQTSALMSQIFSVSYGDKKRLPDNANYNETISGRFAPEVYLLPRLINKNETEVEYAQAFPLYEDFLPSENYNDTTSTYEFSSGFQTMNYKRTSANDTISEKVNSTGSDILSSISYSESKTTEKLTSMENEVNISQSDDADILIKLNISVFSESEVQDICDYMNTTSTAIFKICQFNYSDTVVVSDVTTFESTPNLVVYNTIYHKYCSAASLVKYQIEIVASILVNVTNQDYISTLFKRYLKQLLKLTGCDFADRILFNAQSSLMHSWINVSLNEKQHCHQNFENLKNQLLNRLNFSQALAQSFLPIFKLENISITEQSLCKIPMQVSSTVIIAVVCTMSLFPCIFLLIVKILCPHICMQPKEKKVKSTLKSRMPIVFNDEIGNSVQSLQRNSQYIYGISNETFCQTETSATSV